jgi:hypothetical protein
MKEIRKDIKWYEWVYQVSSFWNVRSLDRIQKIYQKDRCGRNIEVNRRVKWKLLRNTIHNSWYCRLSIWEKWYLLHRLVFCTFNDLSLEFKWQKSNTLICHKNDIKTDNRLDNLFLWTQQDNVDDMIRKWRKVQWKLKKVKIWYDDIENIKSEYKRLWSIYKVAPLFWVSYATISRVINWKIRK